MMLSRTIMLGMLVALTPIQVKLWSQTKGVQGELDTVTAQGIALLVDGSAVPRVIPWYDLKQVEPSNTNTERFAPFADRAWRAHTRIDRGDFDGALPLYESMRDAYLWEIGPQSMDIGIGLKRCLISQQQRTQAIEPALSWFVSAKLHTLESSVAEPSVDPQTMLHIDLPPIMIESSKSQVLAELPESLNRTDRERLLFAYFRLVHEGVNRQELIVERIDQLKRSLRARDPGIVLMEQMAFAQAHPETSRRIAAQDALRRRTQTQHDTWIEVWSRLALGSALLRESDPIKQDEGVIELLHVVVRLSDIDTNLTMTAAEIAAGHLKATNRAQWADQIMQDARNHITNPNASQEYLSND